MNTFNFWRADFAKYVGPTVKSHRNLIGPIKPTFYSDQMSAIVWNRISAFTDVRSRFPCFSFVAWFPVKVKILIPRLNYFEAAVLWKERTVDTSYGAECIRNQKCEANRVERINSNRAMENSATLAFTHCYMTYMYARTIGSWWISILLVYVPKHFWNWLHKKKGLSCARLRKSGMHIKTSHISSATTATGIQILRATF